MLVSLLATLALLSRASHFPPLARADCECGYWTTVDGRSDRAVFTDLLETDFTEILDIVPDGDWASVEFNLTKQQARGRYGQSYDASNVATSQVSRTESRHGNEKSTTGLTGDRMLQLVVNSAPRGEYIIGAELDTERLDLFYGTFRASMKVTEISGTCPAFFWVGGTYFLLSCRSWGLRAKSSW